MHIVITAGPTREALDPVRYLSNHSSGKMGYALASAAIEFEQSVTLISGPTQLDIPAGVDFVPVESALDMHRAMAHFAPKADIIICCAAVADYRPASPQTQKIKKSAERITLELIKNPDILADCRRHFGFRGALIGFAAETTQVEEYAREKLRQKGCDLIVANDVSQEGIGFNSDDNEVLLIFPDRTEKLPRCSKEELGLALIQHCLEIAEEKSQN